MTTRQTTFRGRILDAERSGYRPRQEVELLMRGMIGVILCKPQWWLKWRGVVRAASETDKPIADKWLDEIVRVVLRNRFRRITKHWRFWFMGSVNDYKREMLQRLVHFPPLDRSGDEYQQQQRSVRPTIAYEYFWYPETWPEEMVDDDELSVDDEDYDEELDDEDYDEELDDEDYDEELDDEDYDKELDDEDYDVELDDEDYNEEFPTCGRFFSHVVDEDFPTCRRFFTSSTFRDKFQARDSTSVLCWYFAVVALSARVQSRGGTEWPFDATLNMEDESVRQRAMDLIIAAHRGDVTKHSFTSLYPDADDRPEAVDLIWYHVERAARQVESIRACVRATLDDLVDRYDLMNPASADAFISPGPVIETWMSDSIVPADVKAKFVKEVAVLEDVPEHEKDWHPGSNQQVLDLVHPSLYCCVFGKTRGVREEQLTSSEEASVADRMLQMLNAKLDLVGVRPSFRDPRYQWIPSDFRVDVEGRVKILSYINNLHPVWHEAMYQSIETIFSKFVPLFDRVLGWLARPREPEPSLDGETDRSRYEDEDYHCTVPSFPDLPSELDLGTSSPSPFTMCGKTVQVITKIAEIHLTPENPTYPGGSWHIEGTETENIVATGIYYFGCENITESKLSFRVLVTPPEYEQNDHLGMATIYGLINRHALVQSLGAATAVEDRCIVFPNTLQHKVEPFQLEDPSKPGVRKILAFFVVDPSKKIPSTSVIPPQQEEWHPQSQPQRSGAPTKATTRDCRMSLETAKAHREQLMQQRGPCDLSGSTFSLCEH